MVVQVSSIFSWWNGDKDGLSEVKGLGVQLQPEHLNHRCA